MEVSEAVDTRTSTRAFLSRGVDKGVVERLLKKASRAPSGGNLQPWRVWVAMGSALERFRSRVAGMLSEHPGGMEAEYAVYPPSLWEPYRSRRYKCGEDMYATIGVERGDREGRLGQFRKNYGLFGAPVGLFFGLERKMEPGQWADLGMFMQTIMLLAREEGLHTCAQESWAPWHEVIREEFGIPDEVMFFSGMALGWRDDSAPINTLRTDRAPLVEYVEWCE